MQGVTGFSYSAAATEQALHSETLQVQNALCKH